MLNICKHDYHWMKSFLMMRIGVNHENFIFCEIWGLGRIVVDDAANEMQSKLNGTGQQRKDFNPNSMRQGRSQQKDDSNGNEVYLR